MTQTKQLVTSLLLITLVFCTLSSALGQYTKAQKKEDLEFIDSELKFVTSKVDLTLNQFKDQVGYPRLVEPGKTQWTTTNITDWTSGFWPGILWYTYAATGDDKYRKEARRFTDALKSNQNITWTHDLGFMLFCSYGNGYKYTQDPEYKNVIFQSAKSLTKLYNPKVGTTKSWTHRKSWQHNTIIDNMMNLELLFWAAKNGGSDEFRKIAIKHAETTLKNHFRPDYTSFHVVNYDSLTGKVIWRRTDQGLNDSSAWARGQAWGLYGYTLAYRETQDERFYEQAAQIAEMILSKLPADKVPYWDFNAPQTATEPRDASAAAIIASALLELQFYETDKAYKTKYLNTSRAILKSLASSSYSTRGTSNPAVLLHSVGKKPSNSEVNVPLIYADYYYLEALLRLKDIANGEGDFVTIPVAY